MDAPARIQLSVIVPEIRFHISEAISKYQGEDLVAMIDEAVARALRDDALQREIERQVNHEVSQLVRSLVVSAFSRLRWDEDLSALLAERVKELAGRDA
jgi:hypothetical protein